VVRCLHDSIPEPSDPDGYPGASHANGSHADADPHNRTCDTDEYPDTDGDPDADEDAHKYTDPKSASASDTTASDTTDSDADAHEGTRDTYMDFNSIEYAVLHAHSASSDCNSDANSNVHAVGHADSNAETSGDEHSHADKDTCPDMDATSPAGGESGLCPDLFGDGPRLDNGPGGVDLERSRERELGYHHGIRASRDRRNRDIGCEH